MNGQIVLCKGWNDGEELKRTLNDLQAYAPVMQSLSVVPVGLTKYRENLPHLEAFTKEDAESVIETVEAVQKAAFARYGLHFVHASDEFYILAGKDFPEEDCYDGYLQIENGVGMARSLLEDAKCVISDYLEEGRAADCSGRITIATGLLAAPILEKVKAMTEEAFGPLNTEIISVSNRFFGEKVTVAGLLVGRDIIDALKPLGLTGVLALPSVMFRYGETVFLDDVTREDVERELGVRTIIVDTEAIHLVNLLLGDTKGRTEATHQKYEIPEN